MRRRILLFLMITLAAMTACGAPPAFLSAEPEETAAPTIAPTPVPTPTPYILKNGTVRLYAPASLGERTDMERVEAEFFADTGYHLAVTEVNDESSLAAGKNGEADCLLLGSLEAAEAFVLEGQGVAAVPFLETYALVAVSPVYLPGTNIDGANAFIEWMQGERAERLFSAAEEA